MIERWREYEKSFLHLMDEHLNKNLISINYKAESCFKQIVFFVISSLRTFKMEKEREMFGESSAVYFFKFPKGLT